MCEAEVEAPPFVFLRPERERRGVITHTLGDGMRKMNSSLIVTALPVLWRKLTRLCG